MSQLSFTSLQQAPQLLAQARAALARRAFGALPELGSSSSVAETPPDEGGSSSAAPEPGIAFDGFVQYHCMAEPSGQGHLVRVLEHHRRLVDFPDNPPTWARVQPPGVVRVVLYGVALSGEGPPVLDVVEMTPTGPPEEMTTSPFAAWFYEPTADELFTEPGTVIVLVEFTDGTQAVDVFTVDPDAVAATETSPESSASASS